MTIDLPADDAPAPPIDFRPRPLQIVADIEWNEPQWDFLSWGAPPNEHGQPQIERCHALGEMGGGKTTVAAGRALIYAASNPFLEGVHTRDDPPMGGICATTMSSVEQGALREFMRLATERLVYRRKLYGKNPFVDLVNGHRINLYSAHGAVDGPSLCWIWADEIQDPKYTLKVWENIQNRVRDLRARRLGVMVSGHATHGLVEQLFRRPRTETFYTQIFRLKDNAKNLAAGIVDALLDSIPESEQVRDLEGWAPPRGVCWPSFSALNLSRAPNVDGLKEEHVAHAGVDLRSKAAVAIGVRLPVEIKLKSGEVRPELGLLLADQLVPHKKSAEEIALTMRDSGWRWTSESVVALDPTASLDEANAIRRVLGCKIIRAAKGSPYWESKVGRRAVARAILDAAGNARLFVHPRLLNRSERGLPETFRGYSEEKLKDDQYEHMADAARYLTQHLIPLPGFAYDVGSIRLDPNENLREFPIGEAS